MPKNVERIVEDQTSEGTNERNNNRSLSLVAWQCITHGAELQKTRQTEVKRSSLLLAANGTDCTLPLYLSVSHKNIL